MDKLKIIRKKKEITKPISIRVPLSACQFMADKNYSPYGNTLRGVKGAWMEGGGE